MTIERLHRKLAQAIVKSERRLTADTAAFVEGFARELAASGREELTQEQQRDLQAWMNGALENLRTGIETAIAAGAQAGILTDERVGQLALEAYAKRWPDGLNLSSRIWKWQGDTRRGVTDVLAQGIRQSRGVGDVLYRIQYAIENEAGRVFEIVNKYEGDWVEDLYSAAQEAIHNPAGRKAWNNTARQIRRHINQLKMSGTRPAADRVFSQMQKAVAKGNAELADQALKWWIYDKQLYHIKRVVRTEMADAAHNAIIAATEAEPEIIGYQWRLSASHPEPDICDYYASVEMGLGRGVWPKEMVPRHKAHPHCMCLLVPRISKVKRPGERTYADFLRNASPERQAQLMPQWAREAVESGVSLDNLIREDGVALITREAAISSGLIQK